MATLLLTLGMYGPANADPPPAPVPLQEAGLGYAQAPRFVGSLSAVQAVELALGHSFQIVMQTSRVAIGQSEVEAVESQARPKISLGSFLSQGNTPMIFSGAPGVDPTFLTRLENPSSLDLYAMLMMPLFTGGQLEARLEGAKQGQQATIARLALALRAAARDTRVAFYEVMVQHLRLEALGWELEQRQEVVRIADLQLRLGKAARVVVLRAEAERARTLQEINRKRADLATAEAKLKTAMGVAVDSQFTYPGEFQDPAAAGSLDDNVRTALADRPDLVAARYGVTQGDAMVLEAVADYAPKGYLVTMLEGMKTGSSPMNLGYQVGLVVSWSLYDGGLRRAQEGKARANLELLKQELQQMELTATSEVVSARARLDAARANLDLAASERLKSDEELRISNLRFELGRAPILEILDSTALAVRARNDQLTVGYESESAYAELLYATGRY